MQMHIELNGVQPSARQAAKVSPEEIERRREWLAEQIREGHLEKYAEDGLLARERHCGFILCLALLYFVMYSFCYCMPQ